MSLSVLTLLLHVRPGEVEVESNDPVAGDEEDRGDGQHKIRDYTQDKQNGPEKKDFSDKKNKNRNSVCFIALG